MTPDKYALGHAGVLVPSCFSFSFINSPGLEPTESFQAVRGHRGGGERADFPQNADLRLVGLPGAFV